MRFLGRGSQVEEAVSVADAPETAVESGGAPYVNRYESLLKGGRFGQPRLTVTIDGRMLRIVAFRGWNVAAWASMDLHSEEDPPKLPQALRRFANRRTRQLSDLPFCDALLRRINLPNVSQRYLGQVVIEDVLETIPFVADEADVGWSLIRNNGHQEVLAGAAAKASIDQHLHLLRSMRVRPVAIYPKAAALASAAGLPDAVVVHLAEHTADLVFVQNGIAHVTHQVALPDGHDQPEGYADILLQAINELVVYEARPSDPSDLETVADPATRVVLTGQVPEGGEAGRLLDEALGGRRHEPWSDLSFPDGFSIAEFAANVGLLMADSRPRALPWRKSSAMAPVVDLLPPRHRRQLLPMRWVGAAALAGVLTLGAYFGTEEVTKATDANLVLGAQVTQLEREVRIERLTAQQVQAQLQLLPAMADELTALDTQLERLQADLGDLIARLHEAITNSAGDLVLLSTLALRGEGRGDRGDGLG